MYDVEDNKLSYNNVDDVFEYNSSFEANPQSVHLFVLVDYPSGMREDLAQRVLKIIQNGNKAGIFTVLVSNKAIEGSYESYVSGSATAWKAERKSKIEGEYLFLTLEYDIETHGIEPIGKFYIDTLCEVLEGSTWYTRKNRDLIFEKIKEMFTESEFIKKYRISEAHMI